MQKAAKPTTPHPPKRIYNRNIQKHNSKKPQKQQETNLTQIQSTKVTTNIDNI